jgi:hypothetical protein
MLSSEQVSQVHMPVLQGRAVARAAAEERRQAAAQRRERRQAADRSAPHTAAIGPLSTLQVQTAKWQATGILSVCGLELEKLTHVTEAVQAMGLDAAGQLRCADFGNNKLAGLSGACTIASGVLADGACDPRPTQRPDALASVCAIRIKQQLRQRAFTCPSVSGNHLSKGCHRWCLVCDLTGIRMCRCAHNVARVAAIAL